MIERDDTLKTFLIFPPHWSVSHPYLSLPCLSAYLNERNIETDLLDLNAKCINKILSKEFIEACMQKIEQNEKELVRIIGAQYNKLMLMGDFVIKNIKSAVEVMKSANFFEIKEYDIAKKVINYAFYIVSQAYSPLELYLNNLKYKEELNFENINEFISPCSYKAGFILV